MLANSQHPSGGVAVAVAVTVGVRVGVAVGGRGTQEPAAVSKPEPECDEHTQSAQKCASPEKSCRQLVSLMSLPQIGTRLPETLSS